MVWDVATGKLSRQLGLGGLRFASILTFSPDGRLLVCGDVQGPVTVWDLDTGRARAEIKGQAGFLMAFGGMTAISPDGTLLAGLAHGRNDSIVLMDPATATELRRIGLQHRGSMRRIFFSPDSRTLVASDDEIHVWESATGHERYSFPVAPIIALSGDGRLLVGGNFEGRIDVWDLATGRKVVGFAGQESGIDSLAFSADGGRLVSTSKDQTMLVWDVPALVKQKSSPRLRRQELVALWADLADEDAFRAYRAQRRLLASPRQAVDYLKDRLRRVGRPDKITSPEEVRVWRAVELLERIGTLDARRVLRAIAGLVPQGRLMWEAQAALDRLDKR
jgi:hypothetical protein